MAAVSPRVKKWPHLSGPSVRKEPLSAPRDIDSQSATSQVAGDRRARGERTMIMHPYDASRSAARGLATAVALVALASGPGALAQGSGGSPLGDLASAAGDAVKALQSAAKDSLLVKDILGAEVTDPRGGTVGHIENLVVIPGGRVVAAIVAIKDKGMGRIPVPFAAVKLQRKAGKLGVALPATLSEMKGMKEVQALTQALPSVN